MYNRTFTKKIKVGNTIIGHKNNVIIQSMCNTKTYDTKKTIKQIIELENNGCEIIRCSIPDVRSAKAIETIKENIHIPLVADIHFDYKLALMAIDRGIDKIRINPGNIGDEENIKKVCVACKKKHIPIRIGVNSGSLSKKILNKYNGKVTSRGLYESAVENVKLLEKNNFHDIVVSIKSSSVLECINAYKLFAKKYDYPLHIGITEAGTNYMGSIKSAIGLGILLHEGLGDTMRVSLSTNPVEELKVAKRILNTLELRKDNFEIISCPTCARTNINIEEIANKIESEVEKLYIGNKKLKPIKIAIMGCAVNGPGEARGADIGIAGGKGEGLLFKKGKIIKKIPEKDIISELISVISKEIAL